MDDMDPVTTSTSSRRREASVTAVAGTSVALAALVESAEPEGRRGASEGVIRRGSRSEDEPWPGRKPYPFALVLRLRVLQIVCGISAMVMGTVGLIEERGRMNLGIGVPAGAATVLAAAASIHGSRGFGGYRPPSSSSLPRRSNCFISSVPSEMRPSRPSALFDRVVASAAPGRRWRQCRRLLYSTGHLAAALWALAAGLCCALLAKSILALTKAPTTDPNEEVWMKPQRTPTLATVAWLQLVLALAILTSAVAALHIHCLGDPDAIGD